MSKIVRKMDSLDRLMNSGLPKRELARMEAKHRRWPLGTTVEANTPIGVTVGKVSKHWRSDEVPHGCSIAFPHPVDLGDANGRRFCHVLPFRNLRKVPS